MTERSIVEAAARLRRHGEPYLVATVVNVHGSAYRQPGARMLLTRFRWVAGTTSGGSLEGDLSNQAWWRTREGEPLLLTYGGEADRDPGSLDSRDDDDIRSAFGLGCDGVVEVLLERVGRPGRIDALEVAHRCYRAQTRGAVATIFRRDDPSVRIGARLAKVRGSALELEADTPELLDDATRERIGADLDHAIVNGLSVVRSYATPRGTLDVFVEVILPPPRLFLVGTGHDAVPVAALARMLGWDVVVYAPNPKLSTRDRFAMANELVTDRDELLTRIARSDRAAGIVMTHDANRDREGLALLAATKLDAIGVLGTGARATALCHALGIVDDPRIRGVGLSLGARTPHEIAMAMLGDLHGALAHAAAIPFDREPVVAPVEPGEVAVPEESKVAIVQERAPTVGGAATMAASPVR